MIQSSICQSIDRWTWDCITFIVSNLLLDNQISSLILCISDKLSLDAPNFESFDLCIDTLKYLFCIFN